jgi:ABC-type antimicrobial peptide transport system permease subunit
MSKGPRRIVGVAADVDDEHVVPGVVLTIYHPFGQVPDNLADNGVSIFGGRLFVHTRIDPYALVTPVTRIVREMSVDQPVEHAATLEDIRAEVLIPDRLNTIVFGGFAAVALAIAIVGVAGVLAFSVSARTREFGIRLAIGSQRRHLLARVIAEGAVMAGAGVIAGAAVGFLLARLAGRFFAEVKMPGLLPVLIAAFVLMAVAIVASVLPAARAARVDVMQALRSE